MTSAEPNFMYICMFPLYFVRSPGKQLRLFDVRLRKTEIHAFGWKQESSESQSALINQAWSPDGYYLSSGSADPTIHIFDIRYKSSNPSQSVQAHQKRVFKAVWHQSVPLLTSISSDLNIGLHRITQALSSSWLGRLGRDPHRLLNACILPCSWQRVVMVEELLDIERSVWEEGEFCFYPQPWCLGRFATSFEELQATSGAKMLAI